MGARERGRLIRDKAPEPGFDPRLADGVQNISFRRLGGHYSSWGTARAVWGAGRAQCRPYKNPMRSHHANSFANRRAGSRPTNTRRKLSTAARTAIPNM